MAGGNSHHPLVTAGVKGHAGNNAHTQTDINIGLDDIGIDVNPDGTPAILSEDQATKEIERIKRIADKNQRSQAPAQKSFNMKDLHALADEILRA